MKFRVILVTVLLVLMAATGRAAPSLVFDARTGEVLTAKDAGIPWHPASLTKLMTAYVAFNAVKAGQIKLTDKIRMSERAKKELPIRSHLGVGATVSLDLALRMMLVFSANDISMAIAEGVGGDLPRFVARMNAAARQLGMSGTYFVNPNGLPDPRQVTTARDMGVLAAAILKQYPNYAHYFGLRNVRVGKRTYRSTNTGLYRRLGAANGMKTGYICASGYNVVASADRNGRRLVAVVLGRRSSGIRVKHAVELLTASYGGGQVRQAGRESNPVHDSGGLSGTGKKIAQITNTPGRPVNLRRKLCKTQSVRFAVPYQFNQWGVSLGRYEDAFKAEALLDEVLLASPGIMTTARTGVLRVPRSKRTYIPMIWGADKQLCSKFCARMRSLNISCDLVPPQKMAAIHQQWKQERAEIERARQAKRKKARRAKKRKRVVLKKRSKRRKTR